MLMSSRSWNSCSLLWRHRALEKVLRIILFDWRREIVFVSIGLTDNSAGSSLQFDSNLDLTHSCSSTHSFILIWDQHCASQEQTNASLKKFMINKKLLNSAGFKSPRVQANKMLIVGGHFKETYLLCSMF